ncbi:MAG TPA: ATP synthase F0 subunit B [Candidatus Aquilonibacter sp.]
MFLQLDGTFFAQLINFAIFFALLNLVFLRPVSAAIRKRREYINSVTSDYDTYQGQAKTLRARAESVRAAARREAEASITQSRAAASNTTAELATSYGAQVASTIEAATKTVAGELDQARTNESMLVAQLSDLMLARTIAEPK